MLFTPMLAASAVGTVEYRSITEVGSVPGSAMGPQKLNWYMKVRARSREGHRQLTRHVHLLTCLVLLPNQQPIRKVNPYVDYLEATCTKVDADQKVCRKRRGKKCRRGLVSLGGVRQCPLTLTRS